MLHSEDYSLNCFDFSYRSENIVSDMISVCLKNIILAYKQKQKL